MRLTHHLPVLRSTKWVTAVRCNCDRTVYIHSSLYRWLAQTCSEFSLPRCQCGEVLLTVNHAPEVPAV